VATILIVGDLLADRNLVMTLLRNRGHRLVEAADGNEGLAVVQSELPDLVIADVLMPVMDGYAFVQQLRLDPRARGIPVLFYTASCGEREAALALSSGPTYVLKKPSTLGDVLELVGRALSGESETQIPLN
jgi:CheY-like chemotaxis protein